MILDMSDAFDDLLQQVIIKTVTTTTVDFVKTSAIVGQRINAVIQPADRNKINKDVMDWNLRYVQVHTKQRLNVGQFVQYMGEDFKIVQPGQYGDYGFYDVIAEQCKEPLLTVTTWI